VAGKIAQQTAKGINDIAASNQAPALGNIDSAVNFRDAIDFNGKPNRNFNNQVDNEGDGLVENEEFRKFVRDNYKWENWANEGGMVLPNPNNPNALAQKLRYNLGQKVAVNSINLNVDPAAAGGLGITFQTGNNDLQYAVIDEAQFRTLMELQAGRGDGGWQNDGQRAQETIVGTDVLLPNGMVGNLQFATERGNKFNLADNGIEVPHEKYVLVSNGKYLTAVRAGEMQYWTEQPSFIQFAEAPQEINVPRVGQVVKFEKTLVKPTDALVIRANYTSKGDGR
jgi:hypothetical protein